VADADAINQRGSMKRNYILAGSFVFLSLVGKAQKSDSIFKKERVKKTEIEFLYNHYIQNGNNSAVTGGIGTEQLTVVAPQISMFTTYKNGASFRTKLGVDVITSASTDNIDFIKSSASLRDARTHVDVVYSRPIKNNLTFSGGTGFSIESDYFSLPLSIGLSATDKSGLRSYGIDFQSYFDDLRWGRLSPSFTPEKLIYPEELRTKQWFSEYKRNSYNVRLSFTQVINKRNRIGAYPEVSYQNGLLSTPFHRVYFNDQSLRVENLPSERWKVSLGIKLNSFVRGRTILKHTLDLYADSFSVQGLGIESETVLKITPSFVVAPSIRFYFQKGSTYFAPYQAHNVSEAYYTSDYDVSTMTTNKVGLALRYAPISKKGTRNSTIEISYAGYTRSNGLEAHIISCGFKRK
jgi:hypothetical protein